MTRGSGRRGGGGRRTKKITRPVGQALAVIFGLKDNGDIVRVTASQLSGGRINLSGPNSPRNAVHASNRDTREGWCAETALLWHLTNVYDVMPESQNGEHEKELYAELEAKSGERKRQLAGG
jgi:hypothetical protein